jgi:hypothetical protein
MLLLQCGLDRVLFCSYPLMPSEKGTGPKPGAKFEAMSGIPAGDQAGKTRTPFCCGEMVRQLSAWRRPLSFESLSRISKNGALHDRAANRNRGSGELLGATVGIGAETSGRRNSV